MKYLTVILLSVILIGGVSGSVSAQSDATTLSECTSDSNEYQECVVQNTNTTDVSKWITSQPDSLSENERYALSLYTSEAPYTDELSNETLSRADEYKSWINDVGDRPNWFDSVQETEDEQEPEDETEEVSKYVEIRQGQWITEKPTWDEANQTGTLTVYSDYDGTIAIVDMYSYSDGNFGTVQVTNAQVTGGETTTITYSAQVRGGLLSNGDQRVSVQSLSDETGSWDLAIITLSDGDKPIFNEVTSQDVITALLSGIAGTSALALLTYIYIWWRDRLLEANLFNYLYDEL